MKVAVTGTTGFIGRHVLTELQKHPVEIVVITRQPSVEIPASPQVRVVHLDFLDVSADSLEIMGNPDTLIHLAWGGLPNYKSLHHFEEELPMHYRFLHYLITSGLTNLFVTGTCFEYGMQAGRLNEQMATYPTSPYGYAKDALHVQLDYLKTVYSFSLIWGRLFYLYGDGQAENSLLPQLRRSVEHGEKIFNMSGGEQLRDYLPVTDVAKYIVSLALQKKDIGTVNICSGKPVSVRKLVEGWIVENNWPITLNLGYYPYPDYEPMAFWGDRQKLDRYMKLS